MTWPLLAALLVSLDGLLTGWGIAVGKVALEVNPIWGFLFSSLGLWVILPRTIIVAGLLLLAGRRPVFKGVVIFAACFYGIIVVWNGLNLALY